MKPSLAREDALNVELHAQPPPERAFPSDTTCTSNYTVAVSIYDLDAKDIESRTAISWVSFCPYLS